MRIWVLAAKTSIWIVIATILQGRKEKIFCRYAGRPGLAFLVELKLQTITTASYPLASGCNVDISRWAPMSLQPPFTHCSEVLCFTLQLQEINSHIDGLRHQDLEQPL